MWAAAQPLVGLGVIFSGAAGEKSARRVNTANHVRGRSGEWRGTLRFVIFLLNL